VGKIRWLTNRARRLVGLAGYGLEIVETVPITVDAESAAEQVATSPKKVVPLRP
jgi:3,4-dihydroxy 2-butanone 4-phosphate synthase/GTP cyclohydrolase II